MDVVGAAGTLSLAIVVGIWALWLAQQEGAWRIWRLVTFAVLPVVALPIVLSIGLASRHVPIELADLALGEALFFAVLVSLGTLFHAGRTSRVPQR